MVELTSRESVLLKGIKLQKVYSFNHQKFEDFYKDFEGSQLHKRKSLVMSFYALYGGKHSVEQAQDIIINDCIHLGYKLGVNLFNDIASYKNILEAVVGELSIVPVGVIEGKQYITKIKYAN